MASLTIATSEAGNVTASEQNEGLAQESETIIQINEEKSTSFLSSADQHPDILLCYQQESNLSDAAATQVLLSNEEPLILDTKITDGQQPTFEHSLNADISMNEVTSHVEPREHFNEELSLKNSVNTPSHESDINVIDASHDFHLSAEREIPSIRVLCDEEAPVASFENQENRVESSCLQSTDEKVDDRVEFRTGITCKDVATALDILRTKYKLADVSVKRVSRTWSCYNIADMVRGPHRESYYWRKPGKHRKTKSHQIRKTDLQGAADDSVQSNEAMITSAAADDPEASDEQIKEVSQQIEIKDKEIAQMLHKILQQDSLHAKDMELITNAKDSSSSAQQANDTPKSAARKKKRENALRRLLRALRRRFTRSGQRSASPELIPEVTLSPDNPASSNVAQSAAPAADDKAATVTVATSAAVAAAAAPIETTKPVVTVETSILAASTSPATSEIVTSSKHDPVSHECITSSAAAKLDSKADVTCSIAAGPAVSVTADAAPEAMTAELPAAAKEVGVAAAAVFPNEAVKSEATADQSTASINNELNTSCVGPVSDDKTSQPADEHCVSSSSTDIQFTSNSGDFNASTSHNSINASLRAQQDHAEPDEINESVNQSELETESSLDPAILAHDFESTQVTTILTRDFEISQEPAEVSCSNYNMEDSSANCFNESSTETIVHCNDSGFTSDTANY